MNQDFSYSMKTYNMNEINDFCLLKNQYDIDKLEKHVKTLDKKILLTTQTLTAKFCIDYIWDPDIQSGSEDSYIYDFHYILQYQKHLTEEELIRIADEKNT